MPAYVSLVKWTDQGIKNFKDSPSRAADFTKLVEGLGGRVRELLWTTGEYDLISVMELPDDEAAAVAGLRVGSAGSIRTTTMRAFNADEMGSIIAKAG
ncbi:MAG: GYD domain-containing protein [Streptosporangiaceae bacterium]